MFLCEIGHLIGNVGYADGHVGTTEDRALLWNYSKIGSLVSADGSSVENFYESL